MPDRSSTAQPLTSLLGNDPDMSELVDMFVQELPQRLAEVQSSWKGNDYDTLRRVAHQLKGACGGYGFPSVGEIAGNLEIAVLRAVSSKSERDLDTVNKQVRTLIELCDRVAAR